MYACVRACVRACKYACVCVVIYVLVLVCFLYYCILLFVACYVFNVFTYFKNKITMIIIFLTLSVHSYKLISPKKNIPILNFSKQNVSNPNSTTNFLNWFEYHKASNMIISFGSIV